MDGNKPLYEFPEQDATVKEFVDKLRERFYSQVEYMRGNCSTNSSVDADEAPCAIEHESRDGFISFNDGGYTANVYAGEEVFANMSGLPPEYKKIFEDGVKHDRCLCINDFVEQRCGCKNDSISTIQILTIQEADDFYEKLSDEQKEEFYDFEVAWYSQNDDFNPAIQIEAIYFQKPQFLYPPKPTLSINVQLNTDGPYYRSYGQYLSDVGIGRNPILKVMEKDLSFPDEVTGENLDRIAENAFDYIFGSETKPECASAPAL
jgi:hypothetical protein